MRVIDGLILYALRLGTWFGIGLVLGLGLGYCTGARAATLSDTSHHLTFDNGSCSGTAVSRNVILTASHCLEATSFLRAISLRPAKILSVVNDGQDHALVRVDIEFKTWAKVGPPPKQADAVRWIGSPSGNANFYREGYVSHVDSGAIFIDGQSFKGDSGAGLFNHRNQVVGVISGAIVWTFHDDYRMQLTIARPLAFTAEQWAAIK